MKIVITLLVVLLITFAPIYLFVNKENKREQAEDKMNPFLTIFVALLFALIITGTIGIILFVLLGTTMVFNVAFSLQIGTNKLIILAIILLIYLFTVDNVIEIILKLIIGNNIFYFITLLFIRILVVHAICLAIGMNETNSLTIAIAVSCIIFIIEVIYHKNKQGKTT